MQLYLRQPEVVSSCHGPPFTVMCMAAFSTTARNGVPTTISPCLGPAGFGRAQFHLQSLVGGELALKVSEQIVAHRTLLEGASKHTAGLLQDWSLAGG